MARSVVDGGARRIAHPSSPPTKGISVAYGIALGPRGISESFGRSRDGDAGSRRVALVGTLARSISEPARPRSADATSTPVTLSRP